MVRRKSCYHRCGFSTFGIWVPRTVEIVSLPCDSNDDQLSSISFESRSRLTRIESNAFISSTLQSILIPRSVQSSEASAFIETNLLPILIEDGNERFSIKEGFRIDILHHKLIYHFSNSSPIKICSDIEIFWIKIFFRHQITFINLI
jgi:hypothetical protein